MDPEPTDRQKGIAGRQLTTLGFDNWAQHDREALKRFMDECLVSWRADQ